MKTGFAFSALLALVALTSNKAAMAADVLQANVFFEDGNCQGDPTISMTLAVANQCFKQDEGSAKFTCTESQYFETDDCTGESEKVTDAHECASAEIGSAQLKCITAPDNKIAKFTVGESCSGAGDVANVTYEGVFVLDACQRFNFQELKTSYKLSSSGNGLRITVYEGNGDCTGESTSVDFELGSCKMSPQGTIGNSPFRRRRRLQDGGEGNEEIALKFTAAVPGSSLGNNAMTGSASVFAFMVAMFGALATLL